MKARRSVLAALALSGGVSCFVASPTQPPEDSIRYDSHSLVNRQDMSGLEAGTHFLEFDAYVPRDERWTQAREEQLRQSIRVAHVTTQTPVTPQVSFTAEEGREDLRRVHVDMELDRPGAWAIEVAGPHVQRASAEPRVLERYDFLAPQALGPAEDPSGSVPNQFLRTVGACNHVYKVRTRSDANRVLRWVKLSFSEGGLLEGRERNFSLDLFDVEGRHLGRLEPGIVQVTPDTMEFGVPDRPGVTGRLRISLGNVAYEPLAGAFTQGFSCAPSTAPLDVGYAYGSQPDVEHIVTPIASAVGLAFDGPK